MEKKLKTYLENTFRRHWQLPALTDYQSQTLTYGEVAIQIAQLHSLFKHAGLQPGDKIALCGRNCSHWAVAFLASITYGAVAVPLLHEFTPSNIHNLIVHSESKLFFVMDNIWKQLDIEQMPNLSGVILINDFTLAHSRSETLQKAFQTIEQDIKEMYPDGINIEHIYFHDFEADDLLLINYTSGTTAASKGVMIPERAIWSNMHFAQEVLPNLKAGDRIVSLLPMAHMYGMAFEFMYEFVTGMHIHFLTKQLSPQIILHAFKDIKPNLIVVVPLILEKIVKKGILPKLHKPSMRILRKIPFVKDKINQKICSKLQETLGGQFCEVIVGGAAFSNEVEKLLHEIHFNYTVGYGMTECAPIICYEDWKKFVPESCGKAAPRMEVKILSNDPLLVPGEIVCKGTNVMLGYYKNEEATRQSIDADGWLHTGDMGIFDRSGNVFIKGRCKNMLLGPSGQNIYPEEVEDAVSELPFVQETVVVQRDTKLIALIYPDFDRARHAGLKTPDSILQAIESHRKTLNASLPNYSQLSKFELVEKEFEKTPKKSIKRFLYK